MWFSLYVIDKAIIKTKEIISHSDFPYFLLKSYKEFEQKFTKIIFYIYFHKNCLYILIFTKVQKAIDNLKNEYTILIIAHRLSTIVNCDNIKIIEDGKISIEGTHEELLSKSHTYKKLCKTELIKN